MNLLIKYPSRQRAEMFRKTLLGWLMKATIKGHTFVISLDADDPQLDKYIEYIEDISLSFVEADINFHIGKSDSKIHACNRDVDQYKEWEVLLLISDDMECVLDGWDEQIQKDFSGNGLDSCMWYHDGSTQRVISTLACIGRKYYDHFGYIYHPDYKSFFCDNEYTEVAKSVRKIHFTEVMLAKHQHPNWGNGKNDALYMENNKHWKHDQDLYNRRKQNGFA